MKKIQKIIWDPEKYVDLSDAKQLDNQVESEVVWLWDRFSGGHVVDSAGMTNSQVVEEMEKWVAALPEEGRLLDESLFRRVRIETFDSQEQIDWLIKEGKFFYAPLKTVLQTV